MSSGRDHPAYPKGAGTAVTRWTHGGSSRRTADLARSGNLGQLWSRARESLQKHRGGHAEAFGRIVHPVLQAVPPVFEYEPGTWGPAEAEQRVAPLGGWLNPVAVG